ncbi:MAG: hypothetical protein ACXWNQ_05840 [Anaerolineales bacterium]
MKFLKKIFPSSPSQPAATFYSFTVKCSRCGENISGHINLNNDLSAEYEGDRQVYHVRKVLIGSGMCFQRIEVEFNFDSSRKVIDRLASGGSFVEEVQ